MLVWKLVGKEYRHVHRVKQRELGNLRNWRDVLVANLPTEDARILAAIVCDAALDSGGGNSRFATADDTGADGARLLVTVEDLTDATVWHPKLPWDDARTHTARSQFDDLEPDLIRERTPVDEHATQLVDAALACKKTTLRLAGISTHSLSHVSPHDKTRSCFPRIQGNPSLLNCLLF